MKQSADLAAVQLYEPDPLLAAALQQALVGRVTVMLLTDLPDQAGQGLLIVGGRDSTLVNRYDATANILFIGGDAKAPYPHLTKPFRLGAFVDQVLRLARRLPVLTLTAGTLHPQMREFKKEGGETVGLTEKEVDLLMYLASSRTPITRETLLEEVWNYQEGVSTHTLETHIYRLRQKIEPNPEVPVMLKTGLLADDSGGSGYYLERL